MQSSVGSLLPRLERGGKCTSVTISSALGNGQRDVVVLFMSAEPPDFIDNGRYDVMRGQMPMAPQCVDQALFSKFFACVVERFGYPIGINCEGIPRAEASFVHQAIPIAEQPQYNARGFEPFQSVVAPEEKSWEVATIRISQPSPFVIIFGKKERSVGALICILVKYLVYRSQQLSRLIQRHLTLNAEIRLKICHQKRSGYSFARNVACYKPETPSAKVQEIEVIAANLASLDTRTRVFECPDRR